MLGEIASAPLSRRHLASAPPQPSGGTPARLIRNATHGAQRLSKVELPNPEEQSFTLRMANSTKTTPIDAWMCSVCVSRIDASRPVNNKTKPT